MSETSISPATDEPRLCNTPTFNLRMVSLPLEEFSERIETASRTMSVCTGPGSNEIMVLTLNATVLSRTGVPPSEGTACNQTLTISPAVLRSEESKGLEREAGVILTTIIAVAELAITSVLVVDISTIQLREVLVRPVDMSNAAGLVPVLVII